MKALRVGVVGLGAIAQKAYLPILTQGGNWQLIGGFSPNQVPAQAICDKYRMRCFSRLDSLASQCDAIFVHSSTASHFQVVTELLHLKMHVYVDKPLAETLAQAEQLIELAKKQGKVLMVGFNRRFAPFYQQLKHMVQSVSLRMEKHRQDSVGPGNLSFTLLDDYLHVIDTALWLGGEEVATLISGHVETNTAGQMLYAEHYFQVGQCRVTTSMHRCAGTLRESIQAITKGYCYQINNMNQCWHESQGKIIGLPTLAWQTTLEQRGFTGAVQHFIDAINNGTVPVTSGEQAIYAQRTVEQLLQQIETG